MSKNLENSVIPQQEPVDSKLKVWIKEFSSVCKKILCHKLLNWGGVKCEDHSWYVLVPSVLVIFILLGGGFLTGVKGMGYLYKLASSDSTISKLFLFTKDNTATVSNSFVPQKRLTAEAEAASDDCDLLSGEWKLWLGDMSRDVRDQEHLFLPEKTNQGLFKYSSPINTEAVCNFIFVPRGDKAVNYVISFDGIYQIVVGDNDYQTISLRSTDSIGGKLYPAKDIISQKERPRLAEKIKPGSTVKVRLAQHFNESGKYAIDLSVKYTPLLGGKDIIQSDNFSWSFNPSPALDLHPLDISVGLIRAAGDFSQVGASFIVPTLGNINK